MMKHLGATRRLVRGLAVAALLLGGWTSTLRADFAYGFAEQTISNLTITPGISALGGVTTSTTSAVTLNGSGPANSAALDTPQAYIGGSPAAPQNDFARFAPGSPPVSSVGDFTRSDALIAGLGNPSSASVVSESYLNGTSAATQTGSSSVTASLNFSPTATGALTIGYNFMSDAFVSTSGVAAATARYGFNITIKDSAGNIVFNSTTPNTNLTLAAPPNGGEIIRNSTEAVTTGSLTAGQNYTLIFQITAGTSTILGVPEPSSIVLMGLGGVSLLGVFRRGKAKA